MPTELSTSAPLGTDSRRGPATLSINRLDEVEQKVGAAKAVMHENVELMVSNLDKAARLDAASEQLAQTATAFRKGARKVRRKTWLERWCCCACCCTACAPKEITDESPSRPAV
ncbi:hypothetical protein AB1Y20_004898 [Prymnesium parvum]|uniref:V-SNARE coiled-coil homology domain-containing protein n=1 Tax=Prymnesium parvum TaxID=97485 RepID=A0AB34J0I6_PRYPA